MDRDQKIFIAGHQGMVGAATLRLLEAKGFNRLITAERKELDLCNAAAVDLFFKTYQPEIVIVAAAKVGGIHANKTYPADFIQQNLAIALHTIHAAYRYGAQQLLFLGSSCIYPCNAPQPIKEEVLLTNLLEKTNEAYAIAKIAGLKLCQFYRQQYGVLFHSLMPTNLYGPGDNYHLENAHVLPALIRRFHEAKEKRLPSITLWGTGTPLREFLYVDDLAKAILHTLQLTNPDDWYNVGTGKDITITALAEQIKNVVGYKGVIKTDPEKPDGMPKKQLDVSKIEATGWHATTTLEQGIKDAYKFFLETLEKGVLRER